MESEIEGENNGTQFFPFNLESIPRHLQALFVEKMFYRDFATFNKCSQLSDKICEFLPLKAKLTLNVFKFEVEKPREKVILKEGKEGIHLNQVPSFISLICESLVLWRLSCFDQLQKHNIQTTEICTGLLLLEDANYVKQLLKMTRAQRLEATVTSEVLCIPELRQVPSLKLQCYEECDESFITELKGTELTLQGEIYASHSTFEKILKQWIDGEREIDKITIKQSPSNNLDYLYLQKNLEARFTWEKGEPGYFVCRSALHQDCLRIWRTRPTVYFERLSKINETCPHATNFNAFPFVKLSKP